MDRDMQDVLEVALVQNLLVLATTGPDGPHASLMSYAADADALAYTLVTGPGRKLDNIGHDARVSLLVDEREGSGGREDMRALTITGTCRVVDDSQEMREYLRTFLAANPHLREFAAAPGATVLRVRAEGILLLKGASNATYIPAK